MANNEFDAKPPVELNTLNSGDKGLTKISFADVMEKPKDPLMEAFEKNQAAILQATARIADIHQRAAQHHPEGLAGFLRNHEAQYA